MSSWIRCLMMVLAALGGLSLSNIAFAGRGDREAGKPMLSNEDDEARGRPMLRDNGELDGPDLSRKGCASLEPDEDPDADARPKQREKKVVFFGEESDVSYFVFCLDRSCSMGAYVTGEFEDEEGNPMTNPSRIRWVKAEGIKTIRNLDDSFWIGQVWFESSVQVWEPNNGNELVQCSDSVRESAIAHINAQTVGGATATHDAMLKALDITSPKLEKVFLLSDGSPNVTGGTTECLQDIPPKAQSANVVVDTILCGAPIPSLVDFMQALADACGGKYKQVGN